MSFIISHFKISNIYIIYMPCYTINGLQYGAFSLVILLIFIICGCLGLVFNCPF